MLVRNPNSLKIPHFAYRDYVDMIYHAYDEEKIREVIVVWVVENS